MVVSSFRRLTYRKTFRKYGLSDADSWNLVVYRQWYHRRTVDRSGIVDSRNALVHGFVNCFGSIVAFTSFNYLLKEVSTEKVATSAYVNPVIAMLLGWYFLEESLSKQSMIASAVLLTGVYFINSRKRVSKTKVTTKPQKV